jgi:putative ABC transport system permease protein
MRKILLSLFIVNILLSFFVFYDLEKNSINNNIVKSGEEQATTILIDKAINNLNRVEAIDTIIATTQKFEADIILNVYNNAPGEKFNLIKYIHLKDSSKIFKKIKVTGDLLENYDKSNNYLDSQNFDNKECIGRIGVLDHNFKIRISTLENLKNEKYILSGYYSVNIAKEKTDPFIKELSSDLQVDVSKVSGMNRGQVVIPPILKLIPMIIVFLLVILVVVFDLISRFKDVGVKKLNGYSDKKLKFEYFRSIGVLYFISSVVSYSFLSILFLKFKSVLYIDLVFRSLIITSMLFVLICLIILIPLRFMNKITLGSAIKNMKPVQIIKRFNYGFKIIFTLILIGLFIYGLKIYLPVYSFYFENLKKWEAARDYAQVDLHYYDQNDDFDHIIWHGIQHKKLCLYVNDIGGIQMFVKDLDVSQESDTRKREEENYISNSVLINNNYLKKHPIMDINGNVIKIDENERVHYILVPEKYAYLEKEILKTYEKYYFFLYDLPQDVIEEGKRIEQELIRKEPELFGNEPDTIKVIFIKNAQGLFTYNMNVYPESNNMIYDRIVEINTRGAYKGGDISPNSGYFIKVTNPEEPFLSISDKVRELGLEAYFYDAYSVYGYVAGEVNQYLGVLSQVAVIFTIAGITIAILIAYSIMIYMEKEKMDLSVKLLNGYSFLGRHGKKLLRTILFYILFLPTFYFVGENVLETRALALLISGMVILDLLLTYFFIKIYEKRNIKDILKGN